MKYREVKDVEIIIIGGQLLMTIDTGYYKNSMLARLEQKDDINNKFKSLRKVIIMFIRMGIFFNVKDRYPTANTLAGLPIVKQFFPEHKHWKFADLDRRSTNALVKWLKD